MGEMYLGLRMGRVPWIDQSVDYQPSSDPNYVLAALRGYLDSAHDDSSAALSTVQ